MMAHEFRLPTVTEEDLVKFHLATYGKPFQLATTVHDEASLEEEELDDEDGLGYYPDGVKRTLTDDQIAIFRHSEIHALRQKKRREDEAEYLESHYSEGEVCSNEDETLLVLGKHDLPDTKQADAASSEGEIEEDCAEEPAKLSNPNNDTIRREEDANADEDDEEAEYARFLEQERKEFDEAASSQRRLLDQQRAQFDRTVSTRRKVREMDAFSHSVEQVLDYGDEGGATTVKANSVDRNSVHSSDKAPVEKERIQGRKIWWPTIGT